MNKSDLIKNISFKIGNVKKNDTEEAVNQLINHISDSLLEKNRVEIRGFGTFSSRRRSVRLARNPKTGTSITVGSKFYTYFRPSKLLKQQVKNQKTYIYLVIFLFRGKIMQEDASLNIKIAIEESIKVKEKE